MLAKRQLLLNLIFLAGIFFVVVFGVVKFWAQIQAQSRDLKESQEQYSALNEVVNTEARLTDQKEKFRDIRSKMDLIIPRNQDMPTILTELEAMSASSGLILDKFNIGTVQDVEDVSNKSIKQLAFRISLTGTYSNFNEFLTRTENNIPFINIQRFTFSPTITEANTFGLTTFDIDALTYFIE